MQSSSQIIITNKPTSSFLQAGCPSRSPNQQCQSTEGKEYANTTRQRAMHEERDIVMANPSVSPSVRLTSAGIVS